MHIIHGTVKEILFFNRRTHIKFQIVSCNQIKFCVELTNQIFER
jgi:hypothetical protein